MNLEEAVRTLDLGDYAEVAALLEQEGVSGVKGDNCACPVSNYLLLKTGQRDPADSNRIGDFDEWKVPKGKAFEDGRPVTPTAVALFMHWFDRDRFPGLKEAS